MRTGKDDEFDDSEKRSNSWTEIALSVILVSIGANFAVQAFVLFKAGRIFDCVIYTSISMVVLGGCFDPFNFLWYCLPFTLRPIVRRPLHPIGIGLSLAGLIVLLIGATYKIWCPFHCG
jgi:hypothetical protein